MVALTRGIPAPMLAAMAGVFHPVVFVWLDWPGGAIRAHSAVGTITWGGHNWIGVGPFGAINLPGEFGSMVNAEADLSILGDPVTLDDYADDVIRNRDGGIYFGCLTGRVGTSTTLVSDPVTVFSGQMDVYEIEATDADGGATHRGTVRLITGPGARSDAAVFHSDQDQARRFPGDTAGRHLVLAQARAQKTTWPES